MTLFWSYVAGLTVLAMAFFILPLLRKKKTTLISSDELNLSVFEQQLADLDQDLKAGSLDQSQYDAAKRDLEKVLLQDVSGDQIEHAVVKDTGRWIIGAAFFIPFVALFIYQLLGSPEIIERLAAAPASAPQQPGSAHAQSQQGDMPPMDELVRKLAAKLENDPNNTQGWIMLARSYEAMGQPGQAQATLSKALDHNSDSVTIMLAYAESIAKQAGNDFTGDAAVLIDKAYKLQPDNPNVLWLHGISAYQTENYRGALTHWEKLADILGPQSKELAAVDEAINDVRAKLGIAGTLPAISSSQSAEPEPVKTAAASTAGITLTVTLSPEMQSKANPDQTVFIYAKAVSGPPMPLAAARKQVKDLPITIKLDDSMAMMPQMRMSNFDEVTVGARVSISGGGPGAQSGDLEGEISPVKTKASAEIDLVIDSIHP